MYTADDARIQNLPHNPRATALLTACGHAIPTEAQQKPSIGGPPVGGIHGDAFVGRYHDNELEDIWERESMTLKDVDLLTNNGPVQSYPEWIETALKPGGGGSANSLSNVQTIEDLKIGQEEKYSWSQNDEEVELRFPVDAGVKGKDCKVNFGRKSLKVTVGGEILLDATLGGDVDVEDSTFTIEDGKDGRELCVTLGKKESYTWRTVATPK
jgi:hypothetical protein